MPNETKPFFRRKTTWAALIGAVTAAAGAATGDMQPVQAITLVIQSMLALGLRSAIAGKE